MPEHARPSGGAPRDRVAHVIGELQGDLAVLINALEIIEQGHVFIGSTRHTLDGEAMRGVARDALVTVAE